MEHGLRVVRFLISGGSAAALNFALLWGFTELLRVWYMGSLVVAFIITTLYTFAMQKFWTFRNHGLERVHVQLPQYIALAVINLGINSALLYVLVEYAHLWYIFGQAICIGGLAVMNYFVYQRFIFVER